MRVSKVAIKCKILEQCFDRQHLPVKSKFEKYPCSISLIKNRPNQKKNTAITAVTVVISTAVLLQYYYSITSVI